MTITAQSIIEFLDSRSSSTVLSTGQVSSLISELRSQINQLSVNVPGAQPGATTLLYSGFVSEGAHSGAIITSIANTNPGQVLTINKTEVYTLLDSPEFNDALKTALGPETESTTKIYDSLISGSTDTNGLRVPDSLWDDASRRFAENASGNVLTFTPTADSTRVFAQTELPTLLDNPNVTHINGILKEDIIRLKIDR